MVDEICSEEVLVKDADWLEGDAFFVWLYMLF
jgi:hypothetical protein